MITGAQHGRHNREWAAVCAEFGWRTNDDARRLAFYRQFRLPESRKHWHPVKHFDAFLDACLKIRGERNTRDRERERLVYRIRIDAAASGLDDAYLQRLSTDLNGPAPWELLCLSDLTNLRNAIHNRARTKRTMVLDPSKKFQPAATAEPNPF